MALAEGVTATLSGETLLPVESGSGLVPPPDGEIYEMHLLILQPF